MFKSIVLFGVVAVLATVCSVDAMASFKVEPPCMEVTYNMMVPKNCDHCCLAEGFKQSFFSRGMCRCQVPSQERVRQMRELENSVNEYICDKHSGPSHAFTDDGIPLESACDQCCHQHSFRTYSFKVDYSFASSVGAARGTGRGGLGHSQCLCEGLRLKFKAPESEAN